MTNRKVSLIIPFYNAGGTLRNCLEGVFSSSYPDFECILVNDHSTDNSPDIARSFRAKLIDLTNRHGPAYARNRGAEAAEGRILFFIDGDVRINTDSVEKVVRTFEDNPDIAGLFGSYDDQPWESNFISQYKNLFHHYIHQTSNEEASTFWCGCGAIKREVFFRIGKFNEDYKEPSIEDIAFGYRLRSNNHAIRLVKDLQVKHLKHWSLARMLKSDLFERAVPWTVLMLRKRRFTKDLNLRWPHRVSALILVVLIALLSSGMKTAWLVLIAPVSLLTYYILNFRFYNFFLRKRGLLFALRVIPLHVLYYLYSVMGLVLGIGKYAFERGRDILAS